MPVVLPPELHIQIAHWVRESSLLLPSYYRPSNAVKDISNLSRVNKTYNHISTPILYELVYVTPVNIHAFAETVRDSPERAAMVESLAVVDFPFLDLHDEECIRMVYSLITVIEALGPSLKRLLLDIPFRSIYLTPLGIKLANALRELRVIEEVANIRDEMQLSGYYGMNIFEKWATIKRLAIYNLAMDGNLIGDLQTLPNLEKLCILNPDFAWASQILMDKLFKDAPPAFKQLLLLDFENYPEDLDELDEDGMDIMDDQYTPFIRDRVAREVARKYPESFKMVNVKEVDAASREMHVTTWFRQKVVSGAVWELDKLALDEKELAVDPPIPQAMDIMQQVWANLAQM
ncbi:hypothetical protein FRC02_005411 [Tulasnella sp. 418]|nr:hypothetical protein FRC02_005411 [Tulasnella sp. 418]